MRADRFTSEAFVTLVTSDSYVIGAMVLGHSLRATGTQRRLVCLYTSALTESSRQQLSSLYEIIQVVSRDTKDTTRLALLGRPELGISLTKVEVWRQTQFSKVVFLDADTLVLQNVDELFDREELSAAPDVGWPDCFNSGVLVLRPNLGTFDALIAMANTDGSFDGGDQGLLNQYFSNWAHGDPARRLPFTMNMTISASYSYAPAYRHYGSQVRIIHYIGTAKPWLFSRSAVTGRLIPSGHSHLSDLAVELLEKWWQIHDQFIAPPAGHVYTPAYTGAPVVHSHHYQAPSYPGSPGTSSPFGSVPKDEMATFASYRIEWNKSVEKYANKLGTAGSSTGPVIVKTPGSKSPTDASNASKSSTTTATPLSKRS